MVNILTLDNVSKSFGALKVTDGVSLEVPAGQALGIIGPNGAGKSTLFNLITGNILPDTGRITLMNRDVTRLPAMDRVRLGVGRSFQIPQPFEGLTVFENLLVAATHGRDLPEAAVAEDCARILLQCEMMRRANTPAGALSLLDRKRLELARAMATGPDLLLLDEIAGGLTEGGCKALVATIRSIHAQGTTIIWIEHVLHALTSVVERLLVLDFGKVIGLGGCRVHHHRQRRFQCMGQVARMGARFFGLPLGMFEQRVQLLHHRLHFQRQRIGYPARPALAHPRNRQTHPAQRPQSIIGLQACHHEQAKPQHQKRPYQDRTNASDLGIQFTPAGCNLKFPQRIGARQDHRTLDDPQRLAIKLVAVINLGVDMVLVQIAGQRPVPQRARGKIFMPLPRNLPIEPAVRFQKPLVTQRPVEKHLAIRADLCRSNHRGQHIAQLLVEIARHEA